MKHLKTVIFAGARIKIMILMVLKMQFANLHGSIAAIGKTVRHCRFEISR